MNVELRHLRYFLAVAEELHFGRAAQRLQIAQPALSQQIRRLEERIGAELFHRTKRRVELSAAGEAMVHPARLALESARNAVETARRAARGEIGHLTIGFIETAANTVVPRAVNAFRQTHPQVGLTLREMGVTAQTQRLRSGALDIAIIRPPIPDAGVSIRRVSEEGLLVAVPDGHPLARRTRIHPRALVGEPLVLLAREVVPGLYDQILAMQREHGSAVIAQEATSIQAVLGLVAAGLGVSPLPASVRTLGRAGVAFVTVSPSPRSAIAVATRADDRSPLVGAFVDAVQAAGG